MKCYGINDNIFHSQSHIDLDVNGAAQTKTKDLSCSPNIAVEAARRETATITHNTHIKKKRRNDETKTNKREMN